MLKLETPNMVNTEILRPDEDFETSASESNGHIISMRIDIFN